MKRLLRKVLVITVLFLPLFISTDCKKQKKCGCQGDVLWEYNSAWTGSYVYFYPESSTIFMEEVGNPYDRYTFCNPDEVRPKLANFKAGDILVVKGSVFWDCNYVWQSSNNPYQSYMYRAFNIYVTDIYMDMYGKDGNDKY